MVIYAAVGGRMSLVGAVYGALIVNAGKTFFSESFPELWLFMMAALFIGVTMAFPMGLAGLWESHVMPWWNRRLAARATPAAEPAAAPPATTTRAAPTATASDTPPLPPGVSGQQAA
jgi:urea transport system permease protein